jgi:hypothetical protein
MSDDRAGGEYCVRRADGSLDDAPMHAEVVTAAEVALARELRREALAAMARQRECPSNDF